MPQRARKPLSDAEIALLEAKGAFQIPADGFRELLIESYFTYVHPLLPVIEMTSFWKQYEDQQPRSISILLLQSMFLAACNVSQVSLRSTHQQKLTVAVYPR